MTQQPTEQTEGATEQSVDEVRFSSGVDELFDRFETEPMTDDQIRKEVVKPFFDKVDDVVARGDMKRRAGTAYTREEFADQLRGLQEGFTKPHKEGEKPGFDPLEYVPVYGGLKKAIDELLSNNLTNHAVLDEIAERYGETVDLEQVQEKLGEEALESTTEIPDDSVIDEDAHIFTREDMRRMREAARRIVEEEEPVGPPSAEDIEDDERQAIAEIQEQMNSIAKDLSINDQRALHKYAVGFVGGFQNEIADALVAMSPELRDDSKTRNDYTDLQKALSELLK